jgi:hypothetical protein
LRPVRSRTIAALEAAVQGLFDRHGNVLSCLHRPKAKNTVVRVKGARKRTKDT